MIFKRNFSFLINNCVTIAGKEIIQKLILIFWFRITQKLVLNGFHQILSAFPCSIYATTWLMMWNQTCPFEWFEIWCNTYRDYNFVIAKLFLQTKKSIYFSHRPNSFNQRGFLSFISIFCETSLLHNIKTYGWAFEQCTISHGTICNICRYKARLGGDKIYRKTEMFFSCPDISSNV